MHQAGVRVRKPPLPREIKPEDLPHTFTYAGNGEKYQMIGTSRGGFQVIKVK
jgi:hypothetical protein